MDNTPFSKKCEIIRDFAETTLAEDAYPEFITRNDLGCAFALGVADDMLTLNERGMRWVEETWTDLCENLEIDMYGNYESLDHMLNLAYDFSLDS
jgi:hypothetical protein